MSTNTMEIHSNLADPPIYLLNNDLLSEIFYNNANMFAEDGAFTTTRATSQVCSDWRNLMLAMPLLWGKLIDFDAIARHTEEALWGDELIRRSGESGLWIKAEEALTNESPRQQLHDLFLKVLGENWDRTQKLVVDVHWGKFDLRSGFCKIVSLPAPELEVFNFSAGAAATEADIPYTHIPAKFDQPLFANNAPSLREFKATFHNFNLRAPWIRRLSHLYISHPYPLFDVLDALATSENLELLEIQWEDLPQDDVPQLRHIRLPKLRMLKLIVNPAMCVALLDHIKTPRSCGLHYKSFDDMTDDDVSENAFTVLAQALSKFARRYFRASHTENIALHREPGVLCISNMEGPFLVYLKRSDPADFAPHAVATFFSEFSLPQFSKVTSLWLELHEDIPSHIWIPFLRRFQLARTILASIRDIGFFMVFVAILGQSRAVLPSLKTIKLRPGKNFDPANPKRFELEIISIFVATHLLAGDPIQVIRITVPF